MYIPHVDVTKHKTIQPNLKEVSLFGDKYWVYDDAWRNHLHIICTYKCNAKCAFCIEKNSKCAEINLAPRIKQVTDELAKAGILHTVSFTGGEPGLCKDLKNLVEQVPINTFRTLNTNGKNLKDTLNMGFDFVNLSRHYVDDSKNKEIFKCDVPTIGDLKNRNTNTKLRIQAVVNSETKLEDYLRLIDDGVCDDISFRSLMLDGSVEATKNRPLYLSLIDNALEMGSEVVEQEIQDYYVYEVHKLDGRTITFSYSNMEMALLDNRRISKEFIIRPDGSLSDSWNPNSQLILKAVN